MYDELRNMIDGAERELDEFEERNFGKLKEMVWSFNYEERLHTKEFRHLRVLYPTTKSVFILTDLVGAMEWLKANTNMK